ncbi:hypothetical protein SAMN05421877_108114 [Sphingobacterium lactis]|uniref:Uncharacterized protein n=2 Tax=Sphingobacterium lactis TaxID=797291 RepID=A0A1H6AFY8_9SPHI|nr:hypothetical protein SAMN05421877_108114 [Sphingobacterium lactis]
MSFSILILPLASGYFILTRSYYFKYQQQRLDRQSLLFETVIFAVLILTVGFLLKTFVYDYVIDPFLKSYINQLNPFRSTAYSGTVFFCFMLSILCTYASNLFTNKEEQVYWAIKRIGNEFELLVSRSVKERKLILISLKSDKFYIGWVKEFPIPSVSNYLRIIPAISGIRNDDKQLEFKEHYLHTYAKFILDAKIKAISDLETDVVINIPEVLTISFYDQTIYDGAY